jgi:hypothetical protein
MPKFRAVPKYRTVAPQSSAPPADRHFRLEESKFVTTGWAWRALFMMGLVALGFFINFALQGYNLFITGAWGLIAVGWIGFAVWLWRMHTVWTNGGTVRLRSFR